MKNYWIPVVFCAKNSARARGSPLGFLREQLQDKPTCAAGNIKYNTRVPERVVAAAAQSFIFCAEVSSLRGHLRLIIISGACFVPVLCAAPPAFLSLRPAINILHGSLTSTRRVS
jgi:hypothetical protein